ncbi:response regulator transcription factor [Caballeronia sp. LZ062]|uniref:response regulator n=1 Tax=unclassified Caballeronia TaxID=2646786 RepID=UPI0028674A8F|nr:MULTISPECIES: response regulator transcription factor [unclassified Caballeronia]MDR5856422.1 response regulator transcription factor [Caballeronia sp. LZ050]MDR5873092.1 response regulator transcription factor [Caballeronia sp. LZ062]
MLKKRISVAIVDDHPLVVCGLRRALEEAGIRVIGAVRNPAELMTLLANDHCDVVVTDYSMPSGGALDGWRFLSSVSASYPHLPVLVYSEFDDPFLVGTLAQRDVAGIVSKREEMSVVVDAVSKLAMGQHYRSPVTVRALAQFNAEPDMRRFASLTKWQMEVTGLMLCGMGVVETARLFRLGKSTISARRVTACKQLGFSREAELHRFAANRGLSLDRSGAARVVDGV